MAVLPSMLLTECPQDLLEDHNISPQFSKSMKPLSLSTFLGENGVPFDVCEIFESIYVTEFEKISLMVNIIKIQIFRSC